MARPTIKDLKDTALEYIRLHLQDSEFVMGIQQYLLDDIEDAQALEDGEITELIDDAIAAAMGKIFAKMHWKQDASPE